MKATDLMIGDWVQVMDAATGTPYNCRVRYTIWPSMENALIGLDNEEISTSSLPAECLWPIPITPEILEKNGFSNEECFAKLVVEKYVVICDCSNVAVIQNDEMKMDIPIKYVHELQHALKLCGIDKGIIL